jgi:ABC-type Zn2+ transport system substrate-binding protein/surface adhesin
MRFVIKEEGEIREAHKNTHTHTHTHTQSQTHAHAHARTHARTHTHLVCVRGKSPLQWDSNPQPATERMFVINTKH